MKVDFESIFTIIRKLKNIQTFLDVYNNVNVVQLDLIDSFHSENLAIKIDALTANYKEYHDIDLDLLIDVDKAASVDFLDGCLTSVSRDVKHFLAILFDTAIVKYKLKQNSLYGKRAGKPTVDIDKGADA